MGAIVFWPSGVTVPAGWEPVPLPMGEDWFRRVWDRLVGGAAPLPIRKV